MLKFVGFLYRILRTIITVNCWWTECPESLYILHIYWILTIICKVSCRQHKAGQKIAGHRWKGCLTKEKLYTYINTYVYIVCNHRYTIDCATKFIRETLTNNKITCQLNRIYRNDENWRKCTFIERHCNFQRLHLQTCVNVMRLISIMTMTDICISQQQYRKQHCRCSQLTY